MKSIKIENFQSHENLEIKFDPHITTIIGPSDVGKSAIIRAIRWICTNKPSGNSFIQHDKEECSVTLKVEGHRILRKKGEENSYQLDNEEFKSFGSNVPNIIADVLKIDESNFQNQHDSPYWFMKSPGEVSKELNSIVNLELIDSTLSNIASELRKSKTALEISKDRLKEVQDKRTKLEWTVQAKKDFQKLEEKKNEIKEMDERIEKLDFYINQIVKYERISKEKIPSISKLEKQKNEIDRISLEIQKLEQLIRKIDISETSIWQQKKDISKLEQEYKKKMGKQCPLCGNPMLQQF